jgi:hypothetical protein
LFFWYFINLYLEKKLIILLGTLITLKIMFQWKKILVFHFFFLFFFINFFLVNLILELYGDTKYGKSLNSSNKNEHTISRLNRGFCFYLFLLILYLKEMLV